MDRFEAIRTLEPRSTAAAFLRPRAAWAFLCQRLQQRRHVADPARHHGAIDLPPLRA